VELRWRRGSGAFGPRNVELRLRVGGRHTVIHPRFPPPPGPPPEPPSPPVRTQAPPNPDPHPGPRTHGNLGGWSRGVDDQGQPVPLHDGVLSRAGWYVLDDSRSPLLTRTARGFATRPARKRTYHLHVRAHDATAGVSRMQITGNRRHPGKARRFRSRVDFRSATSKIFVRVRDRAGNWSRWKRFET
jgi:hypothetical protein